jgi:hypothetical protein
MRASRYNALIDAESSVALRAAGSAAVTATGFSAGVSLNELDTAYWHNNDIPNGIMKIMLRITAINLSTNTYTFSLRVDDTADGSDTPTTVWSQALTATGVYEIYVPSSIIKALDTETSGTDKWMQIGVTMGGTPSSPSVTYDAYIVESKGA